MAGRPRKPGRRAPQPPGRRTASSLAQFGLIDVPDDLENLGDSDGGDSDLEAELAALSGAADRKRTKAKPKPKLMPAVDLDNLVAESLKDIPTDEEMSDGDDDPDILNELSELGLDDEDAPLPINDAQKTGLSTPPLSNSQNIVKVLEERLEMYKLAEKNALTSSESGRARRFNRGIKTLNDLLKQAKAGKHISDDDIPPPVSTSIHVPKAPESNKVSTPTSPIKYDENPAPVSPIMPEENLPQEEDTPVNEAAEEPEISISSEAAEALTMLNERKQMYKVAALAAKKSGDNAVALAHLKIVKQFDIVMEALKSGKPVDLSSIPGPPDTNFTSQNTASQKETEHMQSSADPTTEEISELPAPALITANSIEEALQQRLELYKQQEAAASEAGNSSKARRMGRIVKQFQQALKLHAAGKPIPYDELPTPPGYAPIPGAPVPPQEETSAPREPPQSNSIQPNTPSAEKPALGKTGRSNSVRKMGNQVGTCLADQQLSTLLQRQKLFKEAALNAKQKGEIKEAIEYLRNAKGFDPLIEAARCGLPVDLTSVPLPPQAKQELEDSYDIISADDCTMEEDGVGDIINRLDEQLTSQLKLCISNRDHHKAMGDVAGTNRFEHLALAVKQDLDIVKIARRTNGEPPKFHYETKQFSIVQSCTDLKDNDLELTIIRGISYNVANPKDIDTYVRFEFPYPQEVPVHDKTSLVKDTNNPEYNAVYVLPIQRTSRACLRVFKRQGIKLEVVSRGCCGLPCSCPLSCFSGLFTRDAVIGTVNIKLQPLETQTVIHNSYDLMDGRKSVGGKLEVKIRVRDPLLAKQVEQTSQKWLIIDH